MEQNTLQEKLHVIPYVDGIAEYAAQVRREILTAKDTDFIIAVDLPRGLESQVISAVKSLPEISVLVDELNRGIPIIPTSAPVEAVRSFLDCGADLRFTDASLPVIGSLDEYRYFVDQCRLHGTGQVLKDPEKYGLSPGDVLKSWVNSLGSRPAPFWFMHFPEITNRITASQKIPEFTSPYLITRMQCMATNLRNILSEDLDVLFVCSLNHVNGVLHYLGEPVPPVDDSFIVPARSCRVAAEDIPQITLEIPFFMYLYEIYRDMPVEREKWIATVCEDVADNRVSADDVLTTIRYSFSLAVTDTILFPDIYNLVASAKYSAGDRYAADLLLRLLSYPPGKTVRSECSFEKIQDYNFRPLGSPRSLTIELRLFQDSARIRRMQNRLRQVKGGLGYSRFTRTKESLLAELDLMNYLRSHFVWQRESCEEYSARELVCGLGEGIDIREMVRNRSSGRLYIQEPVKKNTACYVLDYRNAPVARSAGNEQQRTGFQTHLATNNSRAYCDHNIFFDKNYPWVGLACETNLHYITGIMVAFSRLDRSPTEIMGYLNRSDPLASAVNLGLKHADFVFAITDAADEITGRVRDRHRVKIMPCSALPPHIYAKMREFDLECWRQDNRRGD